MSRKQAWSAVAGVVLAVALFLGGVVGEAAAAEDKKGAAPPPGPGAASKPIEKAPAAVTRRVPAATPPFSDVEQFRQELNSAGPLKFYDTTEELLRAAQFERALMRYRLLKGQIAGQSAYGALTAQTDRRLHFLKQQLHLDEGEVTAIRHHKRKKVKRRAVKKAAPPCPPVKEQAKAPPDAPKGEDLKKEGAPAPAPSPAPASPGTPAPPATPAPAVEAPPSKGSELPVKTPAPAAPLSAPAKPEAAPAAEETAQEVKPPPPPPSTWEKIKEKLKKRLFSKEK